jgi:putative transposase
MDATHIPPATDCFEGSRYITIGIRLDGTKKVLGFTIAPTEFSYIWKEVLQDLKNVG